MTTSRYHPKIERPITPQQFHELLIKTEFNNPLRDEALVSLLYYSGIRSGEARKLERSSFWVDGRYMYLDVGTRLKHSKATDPLFFDTSLAGISSLVSWVNRFGPREHPFGYSRKTIYRIVKQTGFYPHFFRFNRITQWCLKHPTPVIKGLTGLSAGTIDRYMLKVSTRKALMESE